MIVKKFQMAVMLCIVRGDATVKDMAKAFGCSKHTVARWARGDSEAHPAMRKVVYAWIEGRRGSKAKKGPGR